MIFSCNFFEVVLVLKELPFRLYLEVFMFLLLLGMKLIFVLTLISELLSDEKLELLSFKYLFFWLLYSFNFLLI